MCKHRSTFNQLSGVSETLLITLYLRAIESQRPDALIKDERAEALVRQLDQVGSQEYTARYLQPAGRPMPVMETERAVYAEKL